MTTPSADIAGTIRVTLTPAGGCVGAVAIASTRPVAAARIFLGLEAGEMTRRIGRVFSLCGAAQTVAALGAVEQAMGIAPAPGVAAAREAARLAEMITQTAMRLALHWPRALGLDLRPDLVRAALEAERGLEARVLGEGWRQPGAALGAPGAIDASLAPLMALADDPLPEALAGAIAARGIEGFGALAPGQGPEAGALWRNWDAPAVAEARARHGAGLAARLAAARHDLTILPGQLAAALARVAETPPRPALRATGAGEATVETARGPLTHRVEIVDGIVTACATEAPTEANFTPQGPVATGLIGAPLDPVAAELHVLAIDPCVACTVDFAGA
jgi:uptake hydrogenase large subunit